jgi:hypothetical protein
MAATTITENRSYGQTVLDRFGGVTVPAPVKPHLAAFKAAHDDYEAASARVDEARAKRDEALEGIGGADDGFDASANQLADKIVGAGIGKRQNPFSGLSKHSPSKLTALPYAQEPKAARELVDALSKKKPPAEVSKAAAKLLKDASAIEAALAKLTRPQAAYTKALTDRDALLPAWDKALRKLKKHAASAWDEDEGTLRSLFAPVGAVQAPKRRRPKAKAAPAGAPDQSASK